ncbi:MAG: hypothetical protein UH685_02220 [Bacteroidaceae bacterium]|nr:hypothetical protein [Bacteroidaceae bacterium]
MKKSSIMMLALSGTMLVGCTQSEYIGEAPQQNGKIVFSGASGKMTRATSNEGDVAKKLDGQIKFYGVKNTNDTYSTVFNNYVLWSQDGKTTSNPDMDWEYVGSNKSYGTDDTKGTVNYQVIKYWDYSAKEYNFVAGSPVKAFTYNVKNSQIESATVTDIAGHLNPNNSGTAISTNPIYIADPVKVVNGQTGFGKEVLFNFTRQQSFVRVGVFETIPGYRISAINFYKVGTDGKWNASAETDKNIILTASTNPKYFTGATNATATITYDWTTPSYKFAYEDAGLTTANNWYGGALDSVTSKSYTDATIAELYGKDGDMATSTGYFTVIPTATETTAVSLLVKCDYTLTALDGAETIKVTGATAAIPAAYAKWAQNTSYTYIFKISDNTNGTTGVGGPEGLFPITFDAAVVEVADGTAQGTVTTVSTPSITTYQEGFAAAKKYVTGKPIYVTAQNDEDGTLYDLTGKVKVFALDGPKTEADLILTAPEGAITFTLNGAADNKVGAVTYEAGKYGSFTPGATGYYAIQYMTQAAVEGTTPASYAYKVVYVENP